MCCVCFCRNCLTWRDVQNILVYSAVKFDVEGAEWVENGAGFHHSDQHGFGLMDAYRMTSVAGVWPLVPKLLKVKVPRGSHAPVPIPSNGSAASVDITGRLPSLSGSSMSLLLVCHRSCVKQVYKHQRKE